MCKINGGYCEDVVPADPRQKHSWLRHLGSTFTAVLLGYCLYLQHNVQSLQAELARAGGLSDVRPFIGSSKVQIDDESGRVESDLTLEAHAKTIVEEDIASTRKLLLQHVPSITTERSSRNDGHQQASSSFAFPRQLDLPLRYAPITSQILTVRRWLSNDLW